MNKRGILGILFIGLIIILLIGMIFTKSPQEIAKDKAKEKCNKINMDLLDFQSNLFLSKITCYNNETKEIRNI